MDHLEPEPEEERRWDWFGLALMILLQIGSLLFLSGVVAALALDKGLIGWSLVCWGLFVAGLGASLCIKRTIWSNADLWRGSWQRLKTGLFMFLIVVAAPGLAPLAIVIVLVLDFMLLICFFVLGLIQIKKLLRLGSGESSEPWYDGSSIRELDQT
jgi:hypothetical protein